MTLSKTAAPILLAAIIALIFVSTVVPSLAQQSAASSGPYFPPTPKTEGRAGNADVQVIVFPASMFNGFPPPMNLADHLTFTYNRAITMDQVHRDLIAYNKLTNKALHDVSVTTSSTPLAGAKAGRMTSVTFMAQDVIVPSTGHFDIAPFIEALKPYKTQRLAFVAPAGFNFTGLRTYKDSNVTISVSQGDDGRGAMYTYDVDVNNPSFTGLSLPAWQADPAQAQVAESMPDTRAKVIKILGFVLVGGVAVLVGYVVYSVMIVRPPAT